MCTPEVYYDTCYDTYYETIYRNRRIYLALAYACSQARSDRPLRERPVSSFSIEIIYVINISIEKVETKCPIERNEIYK